MLGPSDIRKNISSLLNVNDYMRKKLKYIIDYRFKKINLKNLIYVVKNNHLKLNETINSLPKKNNENIFYFLDIFQKKHKKK